MPWVWCHRESRRSCAIVLSRLRGFKYLLVGISWVENILSYVLRGSQIFFVWIFRESKFNNFQQTSVKNIKKHMVEEL